jgi:hypothetical protein
MSVELVVAPDTLAAVGGTLRAIGDGVNSAAVTIRSADGVVEPSISAGVDAVITAWGGAAEMLGATTGVLGTLAERAAAGYRATDDTIENGLG